jgi:signal transduction histidine kinase
MSVKSRSLGLIFIAAVIVPSILLAVLSIRSAGREEAWMEKQAAQTLDAEVTHAAGLASAEVGRIQDDLRAGLDVPASSDYARVLARWKSVTPLVAVPFLLSPRYGILWPPSGSAATSEQKRFLRDNGDFLSDRTATTVLQNIAVRYQAEILAERGNGQPATGPQSGGGQQGGQQPGAGLASQPQAAPAAPAARAEEDETRRSTAMKDTDVSAADNAVLAPAAAEAPTSSAAAPAEEQQQNAPAAAPSAARQMAIDTFAQNPSVQSKVYKEARQKGDQLSSRNVAPEVMPSQSVAGSLDSGAGGGSSAASGAAASPPAPEAEKDRSAQASAPAPSSAPAGEPVIAKKAAAETQPATPSVPKPKAQPKPQAAAPSQFVLTSQLLSQIASRGESGIIPRFVGEKLVFLFWERQKDGRIAGCEIADTQLRSRVAGVLESTWTPTRILTLLDENGAPLAAPPDSAGRDWRRPFVAREIGEALPRWEAAAYLTRPDAIVSQARSSSAIIWILVMILFVSVAGGGTMVLSSVYAGMKTAQQKATFVTNVSHELKTPLTSISLFVDLLRRKGPLPPSKREQYLSLMASETERLTRLINNVLDFSRDKGTRRYGMRAVDAADVAAQIVESQRVRLEGKGFALTLEAHGSDTGVRADPEALKQVLLNLLSNAEKYSAETKEIAVTVARGDAGVTLTVSDRGVGVPEREREKIFREFYRVDDSLSSGVQGTGLGLSIARRIARDHGGDITCAPRTGGGTEFTVRLPPAKEDESP